MTIKSIEGDFISLTSDTDSKEFKVLKTALDLFRELYSNGACIPRIASPSTIKAGDMLDVLDDGWRAVTVVSRVGDHVNWRDESGATGKVYIFTNRLARLHAYTPKPNCIRV